MSGPVPLLLLEFDWSVFMRVCVCVSAVPTYA